jgi:mannosyltransferase OCH1-like enzyme
MKYTKQCIKLLCLCILAVLILYYALQRAYTVEGFQSTAVIPTNLWQTYKTKQLPSPAASMRETWISMNPGWDAQLYDDADIDAYIKSSWDEKMYDFYTNLPLGVMKADLWRYLILTTHGGVYTDVDSICKIPINQWFKDFTGPDALVISPEKDGEQHFCQWTIYCTKEHPAMRFITGFILQHYIDNGIDTSNRHFVHETTGPSIWTKAIKAYLNKNDKNAQQLFDEYTTDKKEFETKGIYILSAKHFQGIYSENVYGSLFFGDGYVKWTEQRDILVKEALK